MNSIQKPAKRTLSSDKASNDSSKKVDRKKTPVPKAPPRNTPVPKQPVSHIGKGSTVAGRYTGTGFHERYARVIEKNLFATLFLSVLSIGVIFVLAFYVLQLVWGVNVDMRSFLTQVLPSELSQVRGLPKDRINVLFLGRGGYENDAPNLTDSIIFASYDQSIDEDESPAMMLSIPRDMYVRSTLLGYTKINAVYSRMLRQYGEEQAIAHMMEMVSQIVGEPIQYYAMVDFKGFRDIVDRVGGIEVDVPERVYDNEYPDGNWGYTIVDIPKGEQTMGGKTALEYARSRHTTSDFDRSARQQIILSSLKKKLIDLGYLSQPSKIKELFVTFGENFQTNLTLTQLIQAASIVREVPDHLIYKANLNDSCNLGVTICDPGGLLYAGSRELMGGQSGLIAQGGTVYQPNYFKDIQKFTYLMMHYPKLLDQTREIHIFNATRVPGLARQYATKLKSFGFNVPDNDAINTLRDESGNIIDKESSLLLYHEALTEEDATLQALESVFFGEFRSAFLPRHALSGQSSIEILLGSDSTSFAR